MTKPACIPGPSPEEAAGQGLHVTIKILDTKLVHTHELVAVIDDTEALLDLDTAGLRTPDILQQLLPVKISCRVDVNLQKNV
jgi:hypothetical protein